MGPCHAVTPIFPHLRKVGVNQPRRGPRTCQGLSVLTFPVCHVPCGRFSDQDSCDLQGISERRVRDPFSTTYKGQYVSSLGTNPSV